MAKHEKYKVKVMDVHSSGENFTGDDGKVYHSSGFAPAAVKTAMQSLETGLLLEIEAAYSEKTGKFYINGLTLADGTPVPEKKQPAENKTEAETAIPAPASSILGKVSEFVKESLTEMASLIVDGTPTPPDSSAKVENAAPKKPAVTNTQAPAAPAQPAPKEYVNPALLKDERITRLACLNTATAISTAHGKMPGHSAIECVNSVLNLASILERAVLQGFKPVIEDIKPQVEKSRAAAAEKEAAYAKDQKSREAGQRRSLSIAPSTEDGSSHVEDRHSIPFGGRR